MSQCGLSDEVGEVMWTARTEVRHFLIELERILPFCQWLLFDLVPSVEYCRAHPAVSLFDTRKKDHGC